jgi:hypothetical protein
MPRSTRHNLYPLKILLRNIQRYSLLHKPSFPLLIVKAVGQTINVTSTGHQVPGPSTSLHWL